LSPHDPLPSSIPSFYDITASSSRFYLGEQPVLNFACTAKQPPPNYIYTHSSSTLTPSPFLNCTKDITDISLPLKTITVTVAKPPPEAKILILLPSLSSPLSKSDPNKP
ncbi:hypothetical protein RYX36_029770, partial [Vicia faba]